MMDACPGVLRLHAAADGYMARARLPGGRLNARALAALADAARLGNGIVELTSRAGLQVRGLEQDVTGVLARILSSAGLLPAPTHERVRNILAAPLAGREVGALAPVDALVAALDRGLCSDPALAELPGRFLFAVDDGTHALAALGADVELVAERDPTGEGEGAREGGGECAVFRLVLGGLATSLVVAPSQATDVAIRAARAFLTLREADDGGAWRVRELRGGAVRLAADLGLAVEAAAASLAAPTPPHEVVRRLGLRTQRDGLFAVTALPPLARLDPMQLAALAEYAHALGEGDVRVAPWRTLSFIDVPEVAASALQGKLEELGLVTSDGSGWTGLSACAGLGACTRARVDVRTAAAQRAAVRDADAPVEHWSACERRCGEPPDAGIRMVAREDGLVVSVPA